MAVIAVLGAVAAYCAARAEQESLGAERRLEQGKILELIRRNDLLRLKSYAAAYEDRLQLFAVEIDHLTALRKSLAEGDARLPRLNMEIQENAALYRALTPVWTYFRRSGKLTEDDLARAAADEVRTYGFDAEYVTPPKDQPRVSIWHKLETQLHHEHHKVRWIAVAVLLFVMALAALTFAQLAHRIGMNRLLAVGGYLLAAIALGIVLVVDHHAWRTYLWSALGLLLLAPIGYLLARYFGIKPTNDDSDLQHPGELEGKGFPGIRMHGGHGHSRIGRFTIGMIAVTAVLSAASGCLYALASTAASTSGSEALEHQAELFRKSARTANELYEGVMKLAALSEDRLRLDAATQRADLAQKLPGLSDSGDASERLAAVNRQMTSHYARGMKEMESAFTGPLGPYNDPTFPRRFVDSTLVKDTSIGYALWDASSEASVRSQRRATVYLGMLTLLAVAMYLFGQSLSMGTTRQAVLLIFVGSCLMLTGAVLPAVTAVDALRQARQGGSADPACTAAGQPAGETGAAQAARHYGEGRMLLATNQPERAVGALRCAVAARPTFALANFFLSLAISRWKSPQANEGGYISLFATDALAPVAKAQTEALESLRDQDLLPPPSFLTSAGFDAFLLALHTSDRSMLQRSNDLTRAALALDRDGVVAQFNLVVGLLAARDPTADAALSRGLEMKPTPEQLSGAMTDLNLLAARCEKVNDKDECAQLLPKLRAIQDRLAAAAWPSKKPARPGVGITNVRLETEPSGLQWSANFQNLGDADLTVVWYAYEKEWQVWRVLPAISGPVPSGIRDRARQEGFANDFRSFLRATSVPSCVLDGGYRTEFYVNGQRIKTSPETVEKVVAHGEFTPVTFGDLNLAMCHPPQWKPAAGLSGLVRAYTDRDSVARRGVYLFTYFNPSGPTDASGERKAYFIKEAARHVVGRPVNFRVMKKCADYYGSVNDLMGESTDGVGKVLARAWVRPDGLVHVGVVIDESLTMSGNVADARAIDPVGAGCATLVSMTNVR